MDDLIKKGYYHRKGQAALRRGGIQTPLQTVYRKKIEEVKWQNLLKIRDKNLLKKVLNISEICNHYLLSLLLILNNERLHFSACYLVHFKLHIIYLKRFVLGELINPCATFFFSLSLQCII